MKCELCKQEIEETFLHKIKGSYIKVDGKKKIVCSNCQSKYKNEIKVRF